MIQNKVKGRLSSNPVNALVAFVHLKHDFKITKKEFKEPLEDHSQYPGITLDDEHSIRKNYSSF